MGSHADRNHRIAARRGVEKLNAVRKSVRQAREGAANSGGVSLYADLSLRLRSERCLESISAFGELKLLRPSFDDSRFTDRRLVAGLHARSRRFHAPVPAGLAVPAARGRAIPTCT